MDMVNEWGEQVEAPKPTTVKDFEKLCEDIQAQRLVCEEKKLLHKAEEERLEQLEAKALELLKGEGLDSYKGKSGTVYVSHRTSFAIPREEADRTAFFNYLKARGVYDSMITVNSQTLNTFCKKEFEEAIESGKALEFSIPGIKDAKVQEIIGFRKGK